ncbi:MAG: shikimate dehydrogenase [Yaniella sp.]|uniref:shikimate dehydrogenase n=1 Tax=Yaniella sp. TaxID=2773929 RepID=UPI003F9A1E43
MAEQSYLLGLIGEGVRPSLTPPMHEQEGAAHNLRLVYRPIDLTELDLPASDVGRLLRNGRELGFDAFNITHPCKRVVLEYLDDVDPAAQRLGACNTVLIRGGKLIGYNTDRSGFTSGLDRELPHADLEDVVLLGAGGAGSAVADALVGAGVSRLSIIDPEPDRAEALIDQLHSAAPAQHPLEIRVGAPEHSAQWLPQATGLVNASPIGMFSHPGMPVEPEALHPGLWVGDIVYRPAETAFIQAARSLGCAVMPGKAMAVGQAADTFQLVTGLQPDRDRMRGHLDALIDEEELQGRFKEQA